MHKLIKNQKGVALVFEIIVVAIVVSALAFVGIRIYQAHHKSKTSSTQSKTSASQSTSSSSLTTTDPYAGWKTYTSRCTGYSFKYPPSWSLAVAKGDYKDIDKCDPIPVLITSPSGNIVSWIPVVPFGEGGSCGSGQGMFTGIPCSTITTVTSEKLTKSGALSGTIFAKQYICDSTTECEARVVLAKPQPSSFQAEDNLTFSLGKRVEETWTPFGKSLFFMMQGKETDIGPYGSEVINSLNPPYNMVFTEAQAQAWLNSADVNTASLILKSIFGS